MESHRTSRNIAVTMVDSKPSGRVKSSTNHVGAFGIDDHYVGECVFLLQSAVQPEMNEFNARHLH